jgi:hypothetical protein
MRARRAKGSRSGNTDGHRDDFLGFRVARTRLVTRNALDARQKPDATAAEIVALKGVIQPAKDRGGWRQKAGD